jgi:hypothetical protein
MIGPTAGHVSFSTEKLDLTNTNWVYLKGMCQKDL